MDNKDMNFQVVYCYGYSRTWFKPCFVTWNEVQVFVSQLKRNGYLVLGVNKRTSGNFI